MKGIFEWKSRLNSRLARALFTPNDPSDKKVLATVRGLKEIGINVWIM